MHKDTFAIFLRPANADFCVQTPKSHYKRATVQRVGRWSGKEGILRCEWVVTGLAALTREPLAGQVVNTGPFGWRFWIELGSF